MSNKSLEKRIAKAQKKALKAYGVKRNTQASVNIALKKGSIKIVENLVNAVIEELELDPTRYQNRIKSARSSKYGRIPELISILASIYAWPVESVDNAKEIPELQERIIDTLAENGVEIDGDLLLDIKETKGFNSFLDAATGEIVEGIEPEYEEFEQYIYEFAEASAIPYVDYKMTEEIYDRQEDRAMSKILVEQRLNEEALARHRAMTATTEEPTTVEEPTETSEDKEGEEK